MAFVWLFLAVFFGSLTALYLLFGLGLYVVYKTTGGKLSFRRWWRKMNF